MIRYLLAAFALLLVFTVACRKDRNYVHAVVLDSGNTSSTGCGYLLYFDDGTIQKPDYLPSAFRHDSMQVKCAVHYSGNLSNCDPQNQYEVIIVDDMERAL